jgi:hypothetical protein
MVLTATLNPGSFQIPTDAYVVVRLPDGSLLSLQLTGALPGIVPIARNFVPIVFTGELLRYTFSGGETPGPYSWFGALTLAGTLHVLGGIEERDFTFSP